jgi:hypothetical protein
MDRHDSIESMKAHLMLLVLAAVAGAAAAHSRDDPPPAPLLGSINGSPLGEIPKQQLPATGCAAYLWSDGATHARIAMASADPALLRIAIDGAVADYPRVAEQGAGGFGFDRSTTYRRDDVTAILDMTIAERGDLTQGALVTGGTLTVMRTGKDTVILPVGGLIGCAAPQGETKP